VSLRTLLKREVREVRTKLVVDETAVLGVRLAEAMVERDKLDRENARQRRELSDAHSTERAEVTERIEQARDSIISGSRPEQVEVEEWAEHESGTVMVVRVDSGEVVGSRSMTEAEKQVPIGFVGPTPGEGGAKSKGEG
jgi:hypothetical protein